MSQDTPRLEQRSLDPALYHIEGLCDDAELETILGLIDDERWLSEHHISTDRAEHGDAWELPAAAHPTLAALAQRALKVAGLEGVGELESLRLRRSVKGQGHPGHLDDYEVDGLRLVATVLLTLEQPTRGGHTRFERALPQAQQARPQPKDALLWYNVKQDLSPSWRSWHDGQEVLEGIKTTLGCFIYADPDALEPIASRLVKANPRRLYIITDSDDSELAAQLYEAALAQEVTPVIINASRFDHISWTPLESGSMLYTVGTSHGAHVVEQQLVHEGVATFYMDVWGPHMIWDNQSMVLAKAGLPTPRTFYALTTDQDALRARVEALGGLPIILKVPGRSLGVGVMRLESWATLFSVIDAIYSAQGEYVSMMSCVEPATHWRVIVVGQQAAASYINFVREDDFRTSVDEDRAEHFEQAPPTQVVALAVQACQVLGLEFGGVDVLVHESGRAYVLEVNFPCYFGHPKRAVDQDVAAVMVQHLKAKAKAQALAP